MSFIIVVHRNKFHSWSGVSVRYSDYTFYTYNIDTEPEQTLYLAIPR